MEFLLISTELYLTYRAISQMSSVFANGLGYWIQSQVESYQRLTKGT